MHQTMKKVWAVLLVLCMLLGVVPFGAQAALLQGENYITQQLSLGEDLVLHLRASLPEQYEDLAKDAVGTLTYAGKTTTYTMSDLTPDETGMYDMPVEMAVAQMTDDIHALIEAKVLGVNQEIIDEHYSIRGYLESIIEGDYSQTTKDLCLELLNMGAWAQLYFNYNISDLANKNYSISPAYSVPEEIPVVKPTGSVDGIVLYGATVRLLSKTAVRFYFDADNGVDGYTFTINGAEVQPVAKDDLWYIEATGIGPQIMSQELEVEVTDGTSTLSFGYAPIWYFIRTYNKTEDEYTKALMEAAYSYYKTAENYKTQICMDLEISTLSGNFESIGLGFYPLDFEGDINNYTDRIEVPTGTTYTVKLDQGKYLVDGEFKGIGVTVLGGPTWDATLEDNTTPDRHNIQISGLRLEGPEDRFIDLALATIANGTDGTGYTNANAGGTATVADGIISISNGFFTDGYKITFNEVDTYLCLDMNFTTLGNSTDKIDVRFYTYGFEDDINNYTDKTYITAGTTSTVKLDAAKYLVDGEIPGIGVAIFGGPAWDTTLEDGTYDRHNFTISNIRLEGEVNQAIDLSRASVQTGFANANSGGLSSVADGIISVTGGFLYDGHMITFVDESIPEETEPETTEPETTEPEATEPEATEPEETVPPVEEYDTTLSLDVKLDTVSGTWENDVEIRFYAYNFEGNAHESYTDSVLFKVGEQQTVKLDAAKYLIDGELTGIGIGIFGGPEWNTAISDGVYDRHTVTISNVKLEGEQSKSFDLNKSTVASGTDGTGFTGDVFGPGVITIGDSIVLSDGFQYFAHKISLVEDTRTFVTMDMQIDTLGGDWANDIEIRFYNYGFEGNPHETYTDSLIFKAGEKTAVKLDAEKYLIDGELTGFGIGIFGGPAWDAKLPDGYTPDRHTVTISNVKLEGEQSISYDLNKSTVASGTDGTGFTGDVFGPGVITIGDSIVLSDGFQYFAHKISLVEDTNTYIVMDLQLDTVSGTWANPIDIRFCNNSQTDSVHTTYTDQIYVTVGEKVTVKLNAEKYLVDGQLSGFSIGIFGGPEWNTQISDGVYDRHSVVISDLHLEGVGAGDIDLSTATVSTGIPGSNTGGTIAIVDDQIVISNGFCYDGHKITLADQSTEEPPVEDTTTYLNMDLLFTTLGGSTDPVEIGFYPYNFEGDINDWTDKLTVTAGTTANIQLDVEKYLVDGEITGIGFAIFGGPAWDAKLSDGYTPDRHTITISNACLSGYQSKAFDLSQSTWANGNNGTGFTNANGSGTATIGQSIVITNGFQYDGHKISLVEDTNTYLCLDMEFTTLGGSTDPVNIRLFNYNYEGSVGDGCTDQVVVTAGTTTTIKVKVDNYLVDGQLPGFGFAVFGGPEWNTQLEDGTYDRHSVVISNVRLEGMQEQSFDLNNATVANGTNGTGFTWANSGGAASIVDGELVITSGFMYDAYEITF